MSFRGTIETRPLISFSKQRNPSFSSDGDEEKITLHRSNSSSLSKADSEKIEHLEGSKDFSETNASAALKAKPSCNTIMELARSRIFSLNFWKDGVFCSMENRLGDNHKKSAKPYDDLELAMLLLASAEKVAENDLGCARKSLSLCDDSALIHGTPVQRIVYYFAEALKEKIHASSGVASSRSFDWLKKIPHDVRHTLVCLEPSMIESYQESTNVIMEYTGVQCILDNMSTSNTIHLIDFGIKNGSHWIVLMQALAVRCQYPIEHLKITAVGTSKKMLEETGKWLSSFASTLDICFSFNIILADLMDVKEDLFMLDDDESLAVYFPMRLATLLAWPNHLERLIRVIQNLNPCVMIVNEIEATINSPIFLERFNEALVYFGAVFDCMDVRFESHSLCRKLVEEVYLRQMIQNTIIEEGSKRTQRHERIGFWRAFFARFDLVETVFSPSALSQASLLIKMTTFENFYTSEMDGECLILGWNGIPVQSLSAWKFSEK